MSYEKIQLIFGIGILSIIIFFIVVAIIQTKKNNESDRKSDPIIKKETIVKDDVVKIPLPKHTLIYEYNHVVREYYIATDFQLRRDRYDDSISDIDAVEGVVSSNYINKYTGKFYIGSLFNADEVLKSVISMLEKWRRIEIEVIDNNPENK